MRIILVKHQTPHLNAFPALLILRPRNMNRGMRHTPRPTIKLRVKALDKDDLLRGQMRLVEPPVRRF